MFFHHIEVPKAVSFLQEPLKTPVNLKYQSKGLIYTLHLLSFVEIRLFKVFFWEKNEIRESDEETMRESRENGAGMRDQDPPFQTLLNDLTLNQLTLNLTMLLALVTAQRNETLSKLDTSCMHETTTAVIFTIQDTLKITRRRKHLPPIEIRSFAPDSRLCPITYIKHYITKTHSMRNTTSFPGSSLSR